MKIEKYRPNFFTGFPDESYEINSKEELLKSELVKGAMSCSNFYRLSFALGKKVSHIMAEYDEGYKWYVVGTIRNPENFEIMATWLPKWEPKERKED